MAGGGTTLSFEVSGGQDALYAVMNKLRVIDISNNLGDSKSLITHPYSSTHRRLDESTKAAMGITPSLARLSIGLEHSGDLIRDLQEAFK
jgi:O-succinylhomoserine sulfhydrylase